MIEGSTIQPTTAFSIQHVFLCLSWAHTIGCTQVRRIKHLASLGFSSPATPSLLAGFPGPPRWPRRRAQRGAGVQHGSLCAEWTRCSSSFRTRPLTWEAGEADVSSQRVKVSRMVRHWDSDVNGLVYTRFSQFHSKEPHHEDLNFRHNQID